MADNCTDNTAEVARNMGCHVIERFNKEQVGKGYALTYLLDQMNESGASDPYDAFSCSMPTTNSTSTTSRK